LAPKFYCSSVLQLTKLFAASRRKGDLPLYISAKTGYQQGFARHDLARAQAVRTM